MHNAVGSIFWVSGAHQLTSKQRLRSTSSDGYLRKRRQQKHMPVITSATIASRLPTRSNQDQVSLQAMPSEKQIGSMHTWGRCYLPTTAIEEAGQEARELIVSSAIVC
jgi:hypothetical protein